jgi:FSR family fosmidomycin resistance protein-like MFS transporter
MAAAIVAGLGNGMFHIGGGVDVLNISEEKSSALGVFVSPGAFGIYFGTVLGRGSGLMAAPVLLALLFAAALIFAARRISSKAYVGNAPLSPKAAPRLLRAAACLFLVVCLRSYVGMAARFPWGGIGAWGLALVFASALGKAAGGFLSDRLGPARAAVLSLGVCALLFLFPGIPGMGVAAVFLFNMTMPITLWAVARIFPGAKGFSFGLLTFALFLGFVPVYLGVTSPLWLLAPAAAVSLALILVGIRD